MHLLIAPDKFKGSLTALEAARAIASGWRKSFPRASFDLAPLADGGDGFMEALVAADGGKIERVRGIEDALFRKRTVPLGWIGRGRTAVIEMAQVCGLAALPPAERDPERTTTYGLGRLMRHATRCGARRILFGLGGSATNDGGMGLAAALGFRFLDGQGRELRGVGGDLHRIASIDPSRRGVVVPVVAAVDVINPLFGKDGAARVFAPQKGADAAAVRRLDAGLKHLASLVGAGAATVAGAGAAGGTAYGLMVFCGAEIRPGFDLVAEALDLERRVRRADLIITGEGCLDAQTAFGKAPERLRQWAEAAGKPILAFAGSVRAARGFDAVFSLMKPGVSLEAAQAHAGPLLEATAAEAASAWAAARR